MPLGQPEPSFQLQVVLDFLGHFRPGEQPHHEGGHHHRHLYPYRVVTVVQLAPFALESPFALFVAALARVQRRLDPLQLLDVLLDRRLLGGDRWQSSVDAALELAQLLLGAPPFFASRFLWVAPQGTVKRGWSKKGPRPKLTTTRTPIRLSPGIDHGP